MTRKTAPEILAKALWGNRYTFNDIVNAMEQYKNQELEIVQINFSNILTNITEQITTTNLILQSLLKQSKDELKEIN